MGVAGKRFLMVEDTPEHLEIFSRLLRRAGAYVKAQRRLPQPGQEQGYDCLLLDYMLEGQSLEDYLPQLKENGSRLPCLVVFSVLPPFLLEPIVAKLRVLSGLELFGLSKDPVTFVADLAALCAA